MYVSKVKKYYENASNEEKCSALRDACGYLASRASTSLDFEVL